MYQQDQFGPEKLEPCLPRSRDNEVTRPPAYNQFISSNGKQKHDLPRLRVCGQRRDLRYVLDE